MMFLVLVSIVKVHGINVQKNHTILYTITVG